MVRLRGTLLVGPSLGSIDFEFNVLHWGKLVRHVCHEPEVELIDYIVLLLYCIYLYMIEIQRNATISAQRRRGNAMLYTFSITGLPEYVHLDVEHRAMVLDFALVGCGCG